MKHTLYPLPSEPSGYPEKLSRAHCLQYEGEPESPPEKRRDSEVALKLVTDAGSGRDVGKGIREIFAEYGEGATGSPKDAQENSEESHEEIEKHTWEKMPLVSPARVMAELDESLPHLGEGERAKALEMFESLSQDIASFCKPDADKAKISETILLKISNGMQQDMSIAAKTAAVLLFAKMLWKNPEQGIPFKEELSKSPPTSDMGKLLYNCFLKHLTMEEAARFSKMSERYGKYLECLKIGLRVAQTYDTHFRSKGGGLSTAFENAIPPEIRPRPQLPRKESRPGVPIQKVAAR